MNENDEKKTAKKESAGTHIILRYVLVASVIAIVSALIFRSAFMTTVVHASVWTEKANKELKKVVTIPPTRGEILAHDGSVLATNLRYYTVRMDFKASNFKQKEFLAGLDSLCDSLAKYHPQRDKDSWKNHFMSQMQLPDSLRSQCFLILKDISHEQNERLKTFPFFHRWRNPNKTGLTSHSELKRSYPYGDMARRSIGRVAQTKENPEVHGISGLEKALDAQLYGTPGKAKKVPLTHSISNWTDIPPKHGQTLRTTIDIGIQDIVENELNAMLETTEAKWGTVILMDVKTGDIRAISNLERDTVSGKYIEAMNRALQGFEPGSVMKTISMVVALENGFVTNIDQMYSIGGGYVFGGGSPIRDTHSPAQLPVRRFLEYSSNIGMTKLVAPHFTDDPNQFREKLAELGFLDKFNTGIAGETTPYFPKLDKKSGGLVSLGRQTYGYTSRIPPLYMCAFYNAIANDGKFVRPRIVEGIISGDKEEKLPVSYVREQMCTPEHAKMVRDMLKEVVYGTGGTAKMLKSDLVTIAGKTGTSKIAREIPREELERSKKAMALAKTHEDSVAARPKYPVGYLEGHYRLSFCGFFPYEHPKYTCMVMISDPSPQYRGAGYTSGIVLKNIALKLYSRGLLDNSSDYTSGESSRAKNPTVYAATNSKRNEALRNMLGTDHMRLAAMPSKTKDGTVPDVQGLSARDAVTMLENAGYNVQVRGTGFVAAQTPSPGSRPGRGARVILSLRH